MITTAKNIAVDVNDVNQRLDDGRNGEAKEEQKQTRDQRRAQLTEVAEKMVVSMCAGDGYCVPEAAKYISPSDFSEQIYKTAFAVLVEQYGEVKREEHSPPFGRINNENFVMTVADRLPARDFYSIKENLRSLMGADTGSINVKLYAEQVKEFSRRRRLKFLAMQLEEEAGLDEKPLDELLHDHVHDIESLHRDANTRRLRVISADKIENDPIEWLRPDCLEIGTLASIAGSGGAGKSTIVMDQIARLTTGYGMPGASSIEKPEYDPITVMILGSEDGITTRLRPQLEVAEADMSRVKFLTAEKGFITFPQDTEEVFERVQDENAKLIYIDPVNAFVDSETKENSDVSWRDIAKHFQQKATQLRLVVYGLYHLNKSVGMSATHRILGSVGIANSCRNIMITLPDPDNEGGGILFVDKNSHGPRPTKGIRYEIRGVPHNQLPPRCDSCSRVEWLGEVSMMADEAAVIAGKKNKRTPCADLVRTLLACEMEKEQIRVYCGKVFNRGTVHRAFEKLGLSKKDE